jgi:hypothetical protein
MKKISTAEKFAGSIEKFVPNSEPMKELGSKKSKKAKTSAKKINPIKIIGVAVLAGVLLGLGATSYYFYHKYKTVPSVETDETVAKISKIMELPTDETPTLATVTDKDKVKSQAFFANAENGDRALIYPKAKKAILYRPSTNKIIEVMSLSTSSQNNAASQQAQAGQQNAAENAPADNQQPQPASDSQQASPDQATAPITPLKVAVYNGSKIKGLAATLGDKIAGIEGMTVVEKKNAVGIYDKNIVVDISGNNNDGAQKIAEAIGGEVGSLPEGETATNVDILVIGGEQ